VALAELLERLEAVTGERAVVNRAPMQEGDMQATYADLTKSRRDLGFSPKVDLDTGLRRFVAWYRTTLDSAG
jgi:UDP-glucuronate 4-epimerase